jgi:hypothetical protein
MMQAATSLAPILLAHVIMKSQQGANPPACPLADYFLAGGAGAGAGAGGASAFHVSRM